MRKKGSFLLATLMILFGLTVARADAPHVRMIANDPAFDSLIDKDMLHDAAFGNDAGVMIDAAIMLDRAEKQLCRPHRGGTAADMFRHAWQTAIANGDAKSKERIVQYLNYYEKTDLLKELQEMKTNLPVAPRRPNYRGGNEKELFDQFMQEADDALRRLDMNRAEQLRAQVDNPNCPLTDEDKNDVDVYLEKIHTQIYQATHNEDGTPKRDVKPWGWGHGPESETPAPPAPAPEEEPANTWGPKGPHFGPPIAPPAAEQPPYRSRRLNALFTQAPHGAKVVHIFPGSPLEGRLHEGDIITSLDGVPVNSTWELENHYAMTHVCYMDSRGLDQRVTIRVRIY